jgi:hypothetical protein
MNFEYTVITRWRNKVEAEELIEKLRAKGKKVYSFFEGDGSVQSLKSDGIKYTPLEFMQKYESISDWRNDLGVRKIFEVDLAALKNSENVILLLPAGKSAHIEAGIAYGLGKKLILIGEQKETESLYLIFDKVYKDTASFIKDIK